MFSRALFKRVMTALILIPFILLGIFYLPPISFAIVTGMFMLLAALEWPRLMGTASLFNTTFYLVVIIIAMMMSFAVIEFSGHWGKSAIVLYGMMILWWFIATGWVIYYNNHEKSPIQQPWLVGCAGVFCIMPCWLGLNILREMTSGRYLILYLLVIIWSADTGAYFIGRRWGRRKLAMRVSPNKTRAGLYGALLVVLVLGLVGAHLFSLVLWQQMVFVLLTVLTGLFSVVGDLFISILKRQQQLKDTGNLLPGHGGLLDRIDSLLAGAPFFAIGLLLTRLH